MTNIEKKDPRPSVPELDELLGVPLKVLDSGFIRVIDYMGSDNSVVQAARVSYGEGTKRLSEDRGLIRYLMRHHHTTPFEMCELKLHVRAPMDCWRQWIRHRTASVNEYSTRYSIAIDAAQRTAPEEWRAQSTQNKQGSDTLIDPTMGVGLSAQEGQLLDTAREVYEHRLANGVAREQARKDLPLSTYTEAYWKVDLHNLLHFLELRMDSQAQAEIRLYAEIIGRLIVAKWCPLVWEAFTDYRFRATRFSRIEIDIIAALHRSTAEATALAEQAGLITSAGTQKPNRELKELENKLATLGLAPPWSSQ